MILVFLCLAAAAAGEPVVVEHNVTLVLDAEAGTFRSEDRVTVRGPGRLVVTAPNGVTVENGSVEVADGEHRIVVGFRGTFRNRLLRGGFYVPTLGTARFRVTVTVRGDYHGVATGRQVEEGTYESEGPDVQAAAVEKLAMPLETPAGFTTLRGPAFAKAIAAKAYAAFLDSCGDAAYRRAVSRGMDLGTSEPFERGAMLLYTRARSMGRAAFDAAVRGLRGPRVEWKALMAALGVDLPVSIPVLGFGAIRVQGNRITGTIVGATFRFDVPIRVTTEAGTEEHAVACAAHESAFSFETRAAPRRLELDPDWNVFRHTGSMNLSPALDIYPEKPAPSRSDDPGLRRAYPTFEILESGFRFRGETYGPDDGILLVWHGGAFVHGRTGELPRHDSWAVFRGGKVIARGSLPGDPATRADISPARTGPPEPLVADLLWLAHAKRRAGTLAAQKIANTLRGRLFRAGLKPIAWPTVTMIEGVAEKERTVVLDGAGKIEEAFFPFHRGAETKGPVKFARVAAASDADVKDALVLLPEDADDAAVRALAERGAAAVALVASEPTFKARGAEAAWVGAIPPAVAARFSEEGTEESLIVSRLMAAERGERFTVPCVYLAPDAARKLREHGKAGELRYSTGLVKRQTSNILGAFGDPRRPGLLLVARWDSPGGTAAPDAAAAAVLLDVAARLQRDHAAGRLKRTIVVALLSGTAAGHWGARQLVQALQTPRAPVARPLAILQLDSVGNRTDADVTFHGDAPGVAAALRRAAKRSQLGIDAADAPPPGSAHAVLAEAGVPLLTVANFDPERPDDAAYVDVETMRRVANALYRTARELASK